MIRKKCLRSEKLKEKFKNDIVFKEVIKRPNNDYKIFVAEAVLPNYFMQWRARGGCEVLEDMHEEEAYKRMNMGRHPWEKVPFFVYLGRE